MSKKVNDKKSTRLDVTEVIVALPTHTKEWREGRGKTMMKEMKKKEKKKKKKKEKKKKEKKTKTKTKTEKEKVTSFLHFNLTINDESD